MNKSALTTIFHPRDNNDLKAIGNWRPSLMLPKTERIRLMIQATHPRPPRIKMTFPNASLKNEIASVKKTWAASTFCIKYITKPIPTSHFFQKENQNKFADSPVFLTRPKEKKQKGKKKKSKKRRIRRRKKKYLYDEF